MPFALGIIGILLIVSGARGTYPQLKELLVKDFTGQGNFFYWIVAIGVVGSVGYVPSMEKFSRAFLALIIVAMVLSHRGFFAKFMQALQSVQGAGTQNSGDLDTWYGGNAGAMFNAPRVLPNGASDGSALPPGIEQMNRRFGTPPAWLSEGLGWFMGAK